MEDIEREYRKIKHSKRPPIRTSDRARQIYLQAEVEESKQDCKTELDYIRLNLLMKQALLQKN